MSESIGRYEKALRQLQEMNRIDIENTWHVHSNSNERMEWWVCEPSLGGGFVDTCYFTAIQRAHDSVCSKYRDGGVGLIDDLPFSNWDQGSEIA